MWKNIIGDIIVPIISGLVFLGLAKYCAYIAPLRSLTTGKTTYRSAMIGFIFFGLYLATRPLQLLSGPHPMPLIVNNIREFFMIGLFGPGVVVAELGLAFGGEKRIKKPVVILIFSLGLIIATVFIVTNIYAIGGSQEIFRLGNYIAYDGCWFRNLDLEPDRAKLMTILFICREIDPVISLTIVGIIAIIRGLTLPESERQMYDNLPRKLVLAGCGTLCFSLSMQMVGLIWILGKIPNQWWLYYFGALLAAIFESFSISLPLKKNVVIK